MAPRYANLVTTGKVESPKLLIFYGEGGVGKTTLAAQFPGTVFLGPEKTDSVDGVARFPRPNNWTDFMDQLRDLQDPFYKYKTLAIDSLDHLELMLFDHMKARDKVTAIEDTCGSYGKWVNGAVSMWLEMAMLLDQLMVKKKMDVILLAHYMTKAFADPMTSLPYDRNMLKLEKSAGKFWVEKCDALLFLSFKTHVKSDGAKAKKGKGISDGARVVYTEKRAAHDAKNRFNMPYELPLDYSSISEALKGAPEDQARQVCREIEELMLDVAEGEMLEKMKAHYENIKGDLESLKVMKNRIKVILESQSNKE